ncbi:MAG: hypothetical protein LBF84_00185 [Holosporales bacterium]|jgi:hypothetical protein|nr:hypothetical protein [Holosporales bacterium]
MFKKLPYVLCGILCCVMPQNSVAARRLTQAKQDAWDAMCQRHNIQNAVLDFVVDAIENSVEIPLNWLFRFAEIAWMQGADTTLSVILTRILERLSGNPPHAQGYLAACRFYSGNFQEAIQAAEQAAAKGDQSFLWVSGRCFALGLGVQQDLMKQKGVL